MGRHAKPNLCTTCGENDPDEFGAMKTTCLACRREWDRMYKRKIRAEDQPDPFEKALAILSLINSWKPPGIHRHGTG